ncbi:ABC transporter permease subunit [Yinghuangia aomiensis]
MSAAGAAVRRRFAAGAWRGPAAFAASRRPRTGRRPRHPVPVPPRTPRQVPVLAIAALGIGLAWGKGGMLTLGQGVFFGLGGYAMAMHLKLAGKPASGHCRTSWCGAALEQLPMLWEPFRQPWFAILMVVPAARHRRGTARPAGLRPPGTRRLGFAILTQALAAAFVIRLVGQQGLRPGGTNGLTNFSSFFGLDLADPADQRILYFAVAVVLGLLYPAFRHLVASRYGCLLVAVRDGEDRVRFLGYDPAVVKTVAFTLSAISGRIAEPCSCRSSASSRPRCSASSRPSNSSSRSPSAAGTRSPARGLGRRPPQLREDHVLRALRRRLALPPRRAVRRGHGLRPQGRRRRRRATARPGGEAPPPRGARPAAPHPADRPAEEGAAA